MKYYRVIFFFLILLLIGSVNSVLSKESVGKVRALEGKVEVQAGDAVTWNALHVSDDVYREDTIRTWEDSTAEISLIDESTISIASETTIRIVKLIRTPQRNYRETSLKILMGRARFNVARLFSRESKYEVHTPTAIAGIKGTNFLVWVMSQALTQIDVTDGQVIGRIGDINITLNGGSSAQISFDILTEKAIITTVRGTSIVTIGGLTLVVEAGESIGISEDGLIEVIKGTIDVYYGGMHITLTEGETAFIEDLLAKIGAPTDEGAASPAMP